MKTKTKTQKSSHRENIFMSFRITPEYRTWLEALAETERIGIGDALDRALALYAKTNGIKAPPTRLKR